MNEINAIDLESMKINMMIYKNNLSLKNKIGRLIWKITYLIFFRPFPSRFFRKWRVLVLKIFGAKISFKSSVHASAKIWAPWNLEMGDYSTISDDVDCYNVAKVVLGNSVTVSQRAFLCTASHNIRSLNHELVTAPIVIEDGAWVAAESYVGMNLTIGKGAVIGARAVVVKNVDSLTIVGGNPAKIIGYRQIS